MATSEEPTTVISADSVVGPKQGKWTYKHYAALPYDGRRYEIIDGILYIMPPASPAHQSVVSRLAHYLFAPIELAQRGRLFMYPLDVELTDDVVVQPDILVVLNENLHKITATHIVSSPDLVIDVLSPNTILYDRSIKRRAYERYGIKEYWVVDPKGHTIELLMLEGDTYKSVGIFSGDQKVPTQVVPEFSVEVKQIFV